MANLFNYKPEKKILDWVRVRRQHSDEQQGAAIAKRLRELLEAEAQKPRPPKSTGG